MGAEFKEGDNVEVTGELARLFFGQIGTILEVVMSRADNPQYNIYRVRFEGKHVRMIGLYLKRVDFGGKMTSICA
jgi:hypothetical protein